MDELKIKKNLTKLKIAEFMESMSEFKRKLFSANSSNLFLQEIANSRKTNKYKGFFPEVMPASNFFYHRFFNITEGEH